MEVSCSSSGLAISKAQLRMATSLSLSLSLPLCPICSLPNLQTLLIVAQPNYLQERKTKVLKLFVVMSSTH